MALILRKKKGFNLRNRKVSHSSLKWPHQLCGWDHFAILRLWACNFRCKITIWSGWKMKIRSEREIAPFIFRNWNYCFPIQLNLFCNTNRWIEYFCTKKKSKIRSQISFTYTFLLHKINLMICMVEVKKKTYFSPLNQICSTIC